MGSLLALDMSSTTIGWVLLADQTVTTTGLITLPAREPIQRRCRLAREEIELLLWGTNPEVVAIESPVGRFAKAVIPQARVSGAVLARLDEAGLLVIEVAPTEAKKALTLTGKASKEQMIDAAIRLAPQFADRPFTEHQADAIGIGLAALRKYKEAPDGFQTAREPKRRAKTAA